LPRLEGSSVSRRHVAPPSVVRDASSQLEELM
jgi:hypothetical protein